MYYQGIENNACTMLKADYNDTIKYEINWNSRKYLTCWALGVINYRYIRRCRYQYIGVPRDTWEIISVSSLDGQASPKGKAAICFLFITDLFHKPREKERVILAQIFNLKDVCKFFE